MHIRLSRGYMEAASMCSSRKSNGRCRYGDRNREARRVRGERARGGSDRGGLILNPGDWRGLDETRGDEKPRNTRWYWRAEWRQIKTRSSDATIRWHPIQLRFSCFRSLCIWFSFEKSASSTIILLLPVHVASLHTVIFLFISSVCQKSDATNKKRSLRQKCRNRTLFSYSITCDH